MIGLRNINNVNDSRDISFKVNKELDKILDKYDKNFLSYIARLYEAINGEKIDFSKLKSSVELLSKFNEKQEFNYLNDLLYPEKCIGCKIPSPLPIPSCSFQLHNSVALKTNQHGCLAIYFNPFFLCKESNDWVQNVYYNYNELQGGDIASKMEFCSSLFYDNESSLNGHQYVNEWKCVNMGQTIPAVYNQYRLVSASIVVKYVGRLDIASGVIGGAVLFDETNDVGSRVIVRERAQVEPVLQEYKYYNRPVFLQKYGNFNLAQDAFYWHENQAIEGIRMLYFPLDNSYEEYLRLDGSESMRVVYNGPGPRVQSEVPNVYMDENTRNGFGFFIYTLNAPPNSTCFKVDIYCNFECLPDSRFMNYMPVSLCKKKLDQNEKKMVLNIVKENLITKANKSDSGNKSFWRKVIDKLKNKVPGIGKLIEEKVVTTVPVITPEVIKIAKENEEENKENVQSNMQNNEVTPNSESMQNNEGTQNNKVSSSNDMVTE